MNKKTLFIQNLYSRLFILILLPLITYFTIGISGCKPSEIITVKGSAYRLNYPLSGDIAYSSSSDLTMKIPKGWTTAEDDVCNCIDLWLVRNDFAASINLVTYEVDDAIRKKVIVGNLDTLLYFSKQQKKARIKSGFKTIDDDEFFSINNKPFASFKYIGTEGFPIRVVVFEYHGRIFELSAMPAHEVGNTKVDPEGLFTVQQSLLTSIK